MEDSISKINIQKIAASSCLGKCKCQASARGGLTYFQKVEGIFE